MVYQIKIIFFLLQFSVISLFSQSPDCIYVTSPPNEFKQNSFYKSKAIFLIDSVEKTISENDTLSLIGLSKQEVLNEIRFMINHPNSTVLNDSGNYCAASSVINWTLNNRPDLYAKGVVELTFFGETKFKNGSRKLKLPNVITEKIDFSIDSSSLKKNRIDIGQISVSDFVLAISFVKELNSVQNIGLLWDEATHKKKNIGNYIFSNTMPWEIDNYFKILGLKKPEQNYYPQNRTKVLEDLSSAIDSGYMPIILENHLITADRPANILLQTVGHHYIVIHDFKINDDCNTISLSYWDYGEVQNHRQFSPAKSINKEMRSRNKRIKIKEDNKYLKIKVDTFLKGLKGYWIPHS